MPFLFLGSLVLRADDLPDRLRAKGRADTMLAGIDVYKSPVKAVIAELGPPTKVIDVPETGPVAGERDYEWQKGDLKLVCGTWNYKGQNSICYSVEVWGTDSRSKIGSTGRGLRLGSPLAEIHRIYGQRLLLNMLHDGDAQVTIQWKDDTTLYAFLNKKGRINHIHLLASTE
jgi:hypothetical protein